MRNKANFPKSQIFITAALATGYNEKMELDTWLKRTQTKPILSRLSAIALATAEAKSRDLPKKLSASGGNSLLELIFLLGCRRVWLGFLDLSGLFAFLSLGRCYARRICFPVTAFAAEHAFYIIALNGTREC